MDGDRKSKTSDNEAKLLTPGGSVVIVDNSEDVPVHIEEDLRFNHRFIYISLMFLNGSVLWAYYSCLSAQDYYAARFPNVKFSYLTTLVTSWPMVFGHTIQMIFGIDKKLGMTKRVLVGYSLFIIAAVVIIIQDFFELEEKTGATILLCCFGVIGLSNSLTESTFYGIASLFPVESFTNAVQIGNVTSGVLNITLNTIIRLIVGGPKQENSSTRQSFYIFFSVLIAVCCTAIYIYFKLVRLPSVAYYLAENDKATFMSRADQEGPLQRIKSLARIFKVIPLPTFSQFFIFFISLSLFPGIGCSSGFAIIPAGSITALWFCAPGIIASYNFGDFFGRVMCTKKVYSIFTLKLCFILTVSRVLLLPALLFGLYNSSIYIFGDSITLALMWQLFINFIIGLTNGLLSTVTMGKAPRLCSLEDRESAGYIMVFALFFGISSGATMGMLIGENGWLGV